MKSLGQRDFSAQETMHYLLSLKLVSLSSVIPISLNGSHKTQNAWGSQPGIDKIYITESNIFRNPIRKGTRY